MSWWQDYFGSDDLDLLESPPEPDAVATLIDFAWRRLNLREGSRVLDVGCGRGEYAAVLADRGCNVTAIDGTPSMAGRARQQAASGPGFSVELVDFHDLPYRDRFDAIVCLGNTLGYGTREDDDLAVDRMARALAPGGRLLIEHHHRSWYLEHAVGRTWWEEDAGFVLSEVEHDPDRDRLVTRDIILPKPPGPPRLWSMSLLQYSPADLQAMIARAGLTPVDISGTDGGEPPTYGLPLGPRSPVMLALATKP